MRNYTLKEARDAIGWYKSCYGVDHSDRLAGFVPGEALDNFINGLYSQGETANKVVEDLERMTENREMIQLAAIWMSPGVPVTRPDGAQERGSRITTGDQLCVEWRANDRGDIVKGPPNYKVVECRGDILSTRLEFRLLYIGPPSVVAYGVDGFAILRVKG